MTDNDGSAEAGDRADGPTDDPARPDGGEPDLVGNVVPTAGNLMPGGLPLLPGSGAYSDEPATPVTPPPDPDDPRWER